MELMNEEDEDIPMISVCPECQDEVEDAKIYTCEHCGEPMCSECLEIHAKEVSFKFSFS